MVRILQEADVEGVDETVKKHGVSRQTIHAWRKKFRDLSVDDVKRMKALEIENAKLKKLLAEKLLEVEVLKEVNAEKW